MMINENYINVDDLYSETFDMNNERKHNISKGNLDHCFLCNRPVDKTKSSDVHLTTSGYLTKLNELPQLDEEEFGNSQGFFKIGNECKKKLPKQFIFKLDF